jgi:HSP20 family protein
MGLMPNWMSKFPSPSRRASELFNLGRFFEDFEQNFDVLNHTPSGLSVSSDDQSVYIEAHVPGLTGKDVDVSIDDNNVLWIKGEKKTEEKDKKRKFYRQSQLTFSYCVPLWEEIDMTCEPEAVCKEGVMKVIFTKKKEKQIQSKRIKIKE